MADKIAQEVLQVVYNWFREHGGEWPDFDHIERWLNRNERIDAVQVIRRLPDTLLKPLNYVDDRPERGATILLPLEGVRQCRGSGDDIYNFMAALRWLVERDRDYDPGSNQAGHMVQITGEQLANELRLPLASDPKSIGRLMALLEAEGLVLAMSAHDENRSLALYISPDIRRFQGVENIAQYLKIKSRLRRSGADGRSGGLGRGIRHWQRSWSKSNNKLGIIIAISGIIAVLIALATFVFTFVVRLRIPSAITLEAYAIPAERRRASSARLEPRAPGPVMFKPSLTPLPADV